VAVIQVFGIATAVSQVMDGGLRMSILVATTTYLAYAPITKYLISDKKEERDGKRLTSVREAEDLLTDLDSLIL
jgi:hypothetical protein